MDKYDYIIAGAGCAGLSLLYYIINEPKLMDKKILVIDQHLEKSNDRTWCFWEKGIGTFESLVAKQWPCISIHKDDANYHLPIGPFNYKMIQGIDFYNFVMRTAKSCKNVEWKEAVIENLNIQEGKGCVQWKDGFAIADCVFSSILSIQGKEDSDLSATKVPFLWQHFKGIVVEFEHSLFDEKIARLMDFNVDQKGYTAFMYLLPLSSRSALVEYTLFSPKVASQEEYDMAIHEYLSEQYPQQKYVIKHSEIGAIPMTTRLNLQTSGPIYSIGTIGNAVKPSTGYAFSNIQVQTKNIVESLLKNTSIRTSVHRTRHHFYDAVLLHILYYQKMEGADIFSRIFAKNKASTVFKFLANQSNLMEDVQIMRTLPTRIFLPAAIRVMASSYNG